MRSAPRPAVRALLLALMLASTPSFAADPLAADEPSTDSLADMDLESLMNLDVTSVSKREGKLGTSPAAIFVITGDDIRRSGVRSIPEALRMAPGVDVAQIDANKWAVSIRGFNDQYANKLLVLMDGRSVYTPLFAGVYWDVQDTLLEDIDRIEVIRGPGATLWGANAVNGVINIITKKAKDTQGLLLSGGVGNENRFFGEGRYGFAIGDKIQGRVYAKGFDNDSFWDGRLDDHGGDEWDQERAGFRFDIDGGKTQATVQGDIYTGNSGGRIHAVTQGVATLDTLAPPLQREFDSDAALNGGNLLTRFTHEFTESSIAQLQLYWDRTYRNDWTLEETRDTFDVDFQHDYAINDWWRALWGTDYRFSSSHTDGSVPLFFTPEDRNSQFVTGFLNNEFSVTDELKLFLGTLGEYNSYTGWEIQPSGRFAWTPSEQHTLWGAVSRAVRTPSEADDDVRLLVNQIASTPVDLTPFGIPTTIALPLVPQATGQRNFKSENELAYELGYRFYPMSTLSFDVTGFYTHYDDLRSTELAGPTLEGLTAALATFLATGQIPGIPTPLFLKNKIDGHTYGAELAAQWQVTKPWRLGLTYTYLKMHFEKDKSSSDDSTALTTPGTSPSNMVGLTSYLELPWNLEWDASLKYTDNLPSQAVGSYFRLDTRLAWRPIEQVELAVVGLNLLDSKHEEWGNTLLYGATKVQRSYYGQVTWRW